MMTSVPDVLSSKPVALIVDDDPAVRNSLRFSLEIEGLAVRTFSNADELLEESAFPVFGCLILDHRLPGLSGLQLLAELRRRGVRLPAIVITTNPTNTIRKDVQAADAILIEKPLLSEALYDAIQEALKKTS